jgi:SAM-dependent methyltransferase
MLNKIKGLKYPDEYIIKFFFKENLQKNPGRVLELGCANGNNLMLFHQYGWDVTGIDYDSTALDNAKQNFSQFDPPAIAENNFSFIQKDLQDGLPELLEGFNVLLFPSVLYYLPRSAAIKCLMQSAKLLKQGGFFFLRMRTTEDYRYRRGREVESNGYILDISETGEKGALNVFYREHEIITIIKETIKCDPNSLRILHSVQENLQNGVTVKNDDLIIWGKIN